VDETDVAICRSMMQNARVPFSQLGKELDITPQAVHRRVQALMEAGIIQGTLARLSPPAMGRMWLMVQGISKLPRMDDLAERLSQHDATALL
jgi:DNA-binding Lrp family transcriptional regulator